MDATTTPTAGGFTQADIDQEVARLELQGDKISSIVQNRAFINGTYLAAASGEWFTSSNPATGKVVAQVASCDTADVDQAVQAARQAFESGVWSDLAPSERKDILIKFANLIEANLLELAVLDTIEAGKSISDNLEGDVPGTVDCFKYHAEAVNKLYDQVAPTGPGNLGLIVREPVGVVGLIVPWNFPLLMVSELLDVGHMISTRYHAFDTVFCRNTNILFSTSIFVPSRQAAWKLAPALATGNCCVIKPAELTSLSLIKLGELANEAGIPPGVLNIVPGLGPKAGAAIASHMDIDMVGFTGSTVVGRLVLKAAAESNVKRVSLEMGGKSPQVVFDDAEEDLDKIIDHIMSAAFWNQSENCSCGSRLIVQKGIKPRLLEKLVAAAQSQDWSVDDPIKLTSKCGCMISPQHCEKVLSYIEKGLAEGAKCLVGGKRIHSESGGDFVGITIFDKVQNSFAIAQDEIFGPVLSVIEFETEEEAIRIANDTKYGLAASVYTPNIHQATRVARKLRAGNVSVNCFAEGDDTTPFGGYKQSGFVGRDKSILAHEQYQEIKTIWHDIQWK